MRVLMVTPGTRGDVAPMAGLGSKLQEAGFEVAIAANAAHAPFITAVGCEHRELPGDMGPWSILQPQEKDPRPRNCSGTCANSVNTWIWPRPVR